MSSLALFSACYLIVLGTTYAVLSMPNREGAGWGEARGVLYIFLGVALLWAATDALSSRSSRSVYFLSAALIATTALDLILSGAIGGGLAHGLLGACLAIVASHARPPDEDRGTSYLGVALGGAPFFVGMDALLRDGVLTGFPTVGVSAGMVGAAYVVTGFCVVVVSVRRTISSRIRITAHVLAGATMLAFQAGLVAVAATTVSPLAAGLFRTIATGGLPWWEKRVGTLPVRTLRARVAAAGVTLAAIAGVLPIIAILTGLERQPSFPVLQGPRVLAFWTLLGVVAGAAVLGVLLGRRLTRTVRLALMLDDASAESGNSSGTAEEWDEIAGAIRQNVSQMALLKRGIAERSDSVGGIGHDLRNPLGTVMNAARVLQMRPDDPVAVQRTAGMIGAATRTMSHMVENLVESTRLDSGVTSSPRRESVLAGELLQTLQQSFAAGRDALRLEWPTADQTVVADREALRRILVNLIENALKYAPSTSLVHVLVKAGAGELVFAVVDHGPGIPVAERERVFDRYYRSQAHGEGGAQGFGLGLYVAHQLATTHGYHLWVEETAGGGATFKLAVPLKIASEAVSASTPSATQAQIAPSSTDPFTTPETLPALRSGERQAS